MKRERILRFGLLLVLIAAMSVSTIAVTARAEAGRVETAYFPANVVDVSQGAYNAYSHDGKNVTDICPHGDGSVQAPFTGTIRYIDKDWNYVVLESNGKVRYADGTEDYMCVGFMHDDDISDLHKGDVIQQGQTFYQQGMKAPAGNKMTGAHVHLVVMRGRYSEQSYLYNGTVMIYDALALRTGTEIVRSGYDETLWRYADTVKAGVYTISPKCAPNSCLDVQDWGTGDETNIQLWESTGADNQLFEIVPLSDGSYKIVSVSAKKPLDVYRGIAADEQNVQIYIDGGENARNQKWWLEEDENGCYTITSALSDDMALDVSAGLADNGTNIQIYTSNGTDAQRWILTYVRETLPRITISGETIPTQLKVGENFGIRGTVTTTSGTLTEVYGAIINQNYAVVQSGRYTPNSKTDNLRYSINNDLVFGSLSAGTYTYVVKVTAVAGGQSTTETLINAPFTVGSGGNSVPATTQQPETTKTPEEPNISISGQTVPSAQKKGSNFGIRGIVTTDRGTVTMVYGAILDSNGSVLQSGTYYPGTSSVNLRYNINNDLIFDKLGTGTYTYLVQVTANNGGIEKTQTLINASFTVS